MPETTKTKEKIYKGREDNIQKNDSGSNRMGFTGFLLSIIAFILGWVPILGWVIWSIGFICSVIGLFKKPKGMAIAGTIISVIAIVFLAYIFVGVKPSFE